jgi:ribosomal-protein-alanine acetyltransferase
MGESLAFFRLSDSVSMDSENITVRLGKLADANQIALMSRDLIERGLGWSWTPRRVAKNIRCKDTVTVIACDQRRMIAFAIMYFGEHEAHLSLLAVQPLYQGRGIGRRLMDWLEKSSRVAGIASQSLEVRANNQGARRFYRRLGFREDALLPLYYNGRESAVKMVRELYSRS